MKSGSETGDRRGDQLLIDGAFIALTPLRQPCGKIVHAFAVEADVEPTATMSNTFRVE